MSRAKPREKTGTVNLKTARSTLRAIESFRGIYSSVTVGDISVTFAEPVAERPKATKTPQPRLTAIESLSKKPPEFDWEVS